MFRLLVPILFCAVATAQQPFLEGELIFPLEDWHNHGSCIVECPNGDLLACWFHGSGERSADDVQISGARKVKATGQWTAPFVMADTPEFPDTNCCMIIDPQQRLWLLWPTIQANTWESALMKYKISDDYMMPEGAPAWGLLDILHIKQSDDFEQQVRAKTDAYIKSVFSGTELPPIVNMWADRNYKQATDKLTRRLGWFTRAHPKMLPDGRMLVGLYSDGFSFALVAYTDDLGKSWKFSEPIVGGGNIQPSFAQRKDGSLLCFMRDNGPPPKRIMVSESKDRGETWSTVTDHPDLENPGAGLEIMNASDGDFLVIYNDLEEGRWSLAVALSEDEGKTWKYKRHLERMEGGGGSFHYPSIIEGKDGNFHASYSYFIDNPPEGGQKGKSIKHATFNKAWIMAGDGGK
ncbi:MAG: exo-alpha-sialidase [Candidatus Hydrogenedentes bacterium]|nr:exo-alpha-sialidase [Candidatus Hydrogenedentota bacterium]